MTLYLVSTNRCATLASFIGLILCNLPGALADESGVRLPEPRIQPDHQKYIEIRRKAGQEVDPAKVLNIFATMVQHEKLNAAWGPFASYILRDNSLPPLDRELVILRIGWLCGAAYEWSHHSLTGLRLGMSDEDLHRIIRGANDPGWSEFDRTLIRATDELHEQAFISDANWAVLSARYSQQQMMDLVFTIGEYNMVSMALNSFGVQLDEGKKGFPTAEAIR